MPFILKQVNGSGSKDSNAYDTYTVRKETPISLEGKASPESVKTYNNNQSVGNFKCFQYKMVKQLNKVNVSSIMIQMGINANNY